MEHYFSENPSTTHELRRFEYEVKGHKIFFTTDKGVFSRLYVDKGSDLMINAMPENLSGYLLDMGCGYGAIGLSLAKINPSLHVTMVDINQRAVELAIKNAKANKIDNVTIFKSDGFSEVTGLFDYIVTNPPIRAGKEVVHSILEQSIEHLREGGLLYVVIQKKQGGPSAVDKLMYVYGNCEKIVKSGGYWVLRSRKD
ncbi:16S rRNA m(2)G 1207 methyltransferase [Caldanaerobius fijiensis DSM 17918]|uniref:16S rRNA m(2)G 1207 methyltransferase n=1 Tax=Caldanaerobius fijiensis DSM 17918 TaxID=1121256 RepID=A0A1M5DG07_9THEO|nr:class I SAM-dependent methyltransferase [Caldanaerobius fijiensis]SHF65622.1 16S rRNA m(2)G 1207 methyltransferase [Caldanaerobius fijiensis DSM 17918]